MGQPVGSILEYSVVGQVNGQKTLTVLHYEVSAPSAVGDPNLETNLFMAELEPLGSLNIISTYLSACSSAWTLIETRGQFVGPNRFSYANHPFGLAGSIGSDCRAQNVAGVITKRTLYTGRDQIGSVHMPGVPVSEYAGGEITAGQITRYLAIAAKLTQTVVVPTGGGTYIPVLWHRTQQFPSWSNRVQYTIVQPELRVMRRRTVGLGI
jgi:hypothetical protein